MNVPVASCRKLPS